MSILKVDHHISDRCNSIVSVNSGKRKTFEARVLSHSSRRKRGFFSCACFV